MEGSGKNDMLIEAGARGPQVSVGVCVVNGNYMYIIPNTESVFWFVFPRAPPAYLAHRDLR